MLNLVWMVIVGAVIGLVSSMFVKGSRSAGMAGTILLGIVGYGLGGWLALALGASLLWQWLVGILLAALLLSGYLMVASQRD